MVFALLFVLPIVFLTIIGIKVVSLSVDLYGAHRTKRLEKFRESARKLEVILTWIFNWYLNHELFERLKSAFKDDSFDLKKNKKILQKEFPLIFKFFYDPDFRDKNNKSYIASCKEKYASFFLDLDKKKQGLTDAQLEAVFCDEDAVLANAGAGTGKTKTIESKILHLVVHKNIPIENILVLTFTEKSKTDMLNRIIASLKTAGIDKSSEDLRRNVCTFHSLGKYILDQVASRDKKKGINSENIFSKVIDADEKDKLYSQTFFEIQKDKTIQAALSDYWLYYNIPELDVRTFKTLDEYYERTKSSYQTLLQKNGYNVTVKSFGEYLIANYLWSRWVNVIYEPDNHYYTNQKTGETFSYKPDFYLPDYGIVIEYFWVDSQGNTAPYVSSKKYREEMKLKIKMCEKSWEKFIDIRYADLQKGPKYLIQKIEKELIAYKVPLKERNEQEEFKIVKTRGFVSGLEKTIRTFIALYKESWTTINAIEKKINSYDDLNTERNRLFLQIFKAFFEKYTLFLQQWGYVDFGDMIVKATEIVRVDDDVRTYSHILVDEFQDISFARVALLQAFKINDKETKFFCVGDDWQSIYQFAGSNIDVFLNFEKYFGYTRKITLDTTFRFNRWISLISSAFVMQNEAQTKKELNTQNIDIDHKIVLVTRKKDDPTYVKKILQNIVQDAGGRTEIDILVITRYNSDRYNDGNNFFAYLAGSKNPWETDEVYQKRIDGIVCTFRVVTSHKSKGLEADYAIVDYVNVEEKFNFPSSFDDDPILGLVQDNHAWSCLFPEERRIFYVSITRAKQKVYIVSWEGKESYFVKDLKRLARWIHANIIQYIEDEWKINLRETEIQKICPDCNGVLIKRKATHNEFYGCKNYPRCTFSQRITPLCPKCKSEMVIKTNRTNGSRFWWCTQYKNGCAGLKKW